MAKTKRKAAPRKPNPCLDAEIIKQTVPCSHYAVRLPFKPSTAQLIRYADFHKHEKVYDYRKEPPAVTFDEKALPRLLKKYPDDPIYQKLVAYRGLEKAKGTYVDGIFVHQDQRVRGTFNHNPSTLRLAMKDPSLQVMPRYNPNVPSVYDDIRGMFRTKDGKLFYAVDFGGIEAVITHYLTAAYDMTSAEAGVKLSLTDIHSFFASHVLKHEGKIDTAADLSWTPDNLGEYLHDIKKRFKTMRDVCKTTIHSSHYKTTPFKMVLENPATFADTKTARFYQDFYFDLFPGIKKWWWGTCLDADRMGYITAPDGFRQYFPAAMQWEWDNTLKQWIQDYGPQDKECIASVPQHMGMDYLAKAANVAYYEKFDSVGQYMRLLIHDEIFLEVPDEMCDIVDSELQDIMRRPNPNMPLPPEWGLGECLAILTEGKKGDTWKNMA